MAVTSGLAGKVACPLFYYNSLMKAWLFCFFFLTTFPVYAAVKQKEANIEKRRAPANASAPLVLTRSKPNFCIMGSQSGKAFHSEAAFNSIVWKSDVVYIGETHDEPLDHMAQLDALKAMKIARGAKIAVGFEMVDQALQPVLDDYAAGRLTEEAFLAKAGWQAGRSFDFRMYKPLFDFIIQHKLRALALNVPGDIVGKIAGSGLESLTPEERKLLPEEVIVSQHKKYLSYLKQTFAAREDIPAAKPFTFENHLASMSAWNEGAGSRIVAFLTENPGYSVLVIAGNSRIIHNAAIPASVKVRLKDARQASFYTENAVKCPETMPKEHKDLANYIWYINHAPKPEPEVAVSTAPASK